MKMKMKSALWVILLVLVSVEVEMRCEGCWKHEREALLRLNARFGNPWVDGPDCCYWERVECNTTTGRVAKLDLSYLRDYSLGRWHLNYSEFLVFEDMKSLHLSYNYIDGCVENEGLKNLEVLYLSGNFLNSSSSILSCLNEFLSLKSLYVSYNELNTTSFHAFETLSSKLLKLEVLDLSGNYLSNDILPSLGRFTSLKTLYLGDIGLDSDRHIQGLSSMLVNLEDLDISGNNFNDTDIASSLSGLSSLKSLTLRHCQFSLRSIHNISKLSSLEILDLAGNELNKSILWSSGNEGFAWPTNLKVLDLSFNNFSNDFLSSLSGLGRLNYLDLMHNQLVGSLDISGLLALSNLKTLNLSSNEINNFVGHQGSKSICRLEVLTLDGNKMDGSKLRKSLQAFLFVKELSLIGNEFKGIVVADDFHDLGHLEHLVLDGSSNLVNEFFKSIGLLSSLKVFSLSSCGINGTLPHADWFELKKLEELDLSLNKITGSLPMSFGNMTSLRILDLSQNHFNGNLGSQLASLTSLEYVGFEENQFEVPISFTPFANLSNLKFIYAYDNKVIPDSCSTLQTWVPKFQLQGLQLSSTSETNSLPFPNFLLYQYNLTILDFTRIKLKGDFPNWLLENNTRMTYLRFRNCSFAGTFHLPSHPNLQVIEVSDNEIMGQIQIYNISSIFPNLEMLDLSGNAIEGSLPSMFGQMKSLAMLDLSDNEFSGEIPKNISGLLSSLKVLKLSNNKIVGHVFPTLSTLNHLEHLYLDGNCLSGSISSSFFNTSWLALDISNNHVAGKLPSWIGNSSNLVTLSMSNNHLGGPIPTIYGELKSLRYLDISRNNLIGFVPPFVNSSVMFIHLSNNRLKCLPKRMLNESSSLVALDLSYNKMTANVQDMIQDLHYTGLHILLLKGNHLIGQVPNQLCQLTDLIILDLSYNSLSGPIPSCLGKMPFGNLNTKPLPDLADFFRYMYSYDDLYDAIVQEKDDFTTKKISYTYTRKVLGYMSGIDLSMNKLNGNIPSELGNLTKIRALNLSHNYFSGQIPNTFSNLVQIESLDLSFNKFSGKIPHQLIELTSLAVFSVAYNNLSGATPDRKGQFITFDESSYEGNPLLCGPPLPNSCIAYGQPNPTLTNGSNVDGDNDGSLVDKFVFYVSFGISYTTVLLVIAVTLYINPYWRRAWFYYIELILTNCYYFIEDNLCMFPNIRSM